MQKLIRIAFLVTLMGLVSLVGVAEPVPPITKAPTDSWSPGQLVWGDLLTDDVEAAKNFYGEVFGWQFTATSDDDYLRATHDGMPIAGIAHHKPKDPKVSEVQWLISISVEDVDTAVAAVGKAGGKVLEAARTVPDRGRFAIVEDPEGAVSVFLRASQGDPALRRTVDNEWIWAELWARNPKKVAQFYADTVGYEKGKIEEPGGHYLVLVRDGKPKAGIVELPWEKVEPHWMPYLRVADVQETIEKVKAAGGNVVVAPSMEYDEGRVALVGDPTGGVVAIQEESDES